MLLATILLLCPLPQSGDAVRTLAETPAVSSADTKDSTPSKNLPTTPEPKIKSDAALSAAVTPAEAVTPGSPAVKPGKAAFRRDYDTSRQKKQWYALTFASSGAAAFDAWSTRRAISGGYGSEANPFLAPFAKGNALYAATQVSPAVMDLIGRKLMSSRNPSLRKLWWLPQTAGMSFSVFAGVHNVRLVH